MSAPALDTDLPVPRGELVAGKYRIDRVIGSGGMGYVVAATHVQLNQRVAIKFLHADSLGDPDSAPRFMREARAAVALSSEHVARVHDVGTLESGAPFMVMEYLEGESLAARLARRAPLDVGEVMSIASQACVALAEAHRAGIVHRDVKPGNMFLTRRDGREVLKVLDFGIAKMADPLASAAPNLTTTSQILGTPRYMSPEQLGSTRDVGPPTDVWAIGVTIYECLTGKPAFETGSAFEVGARILATELPRLRSVRPDVPPALDEIVVRCLRKDPVDRFANAGELLAALEGKPVAPPRSERMVGSASPLSLSELPATRISDRIAIPRSNPSAPVVAAANPMLAAPTTRDGTPSRGLVISLASLLTVIAMMAYVGVRFRRAAANEVSDPQVVAAPNTTPQSALPASAPSTPDPHSTATPSPPADEPAPAPSAAASPPPPAVRRTAPAPRRAGAPAPRATVMTRPPDER